MARKTKVTTWVTLDAHRALRELAASHRLPLSQVAADLLHRGLREQAETAGLGLLGPALEAVVRREVSRMSDRVSHLLARAALEAATARRLLYQLLIREVGAEEARRLNQAAWTGSVDSLRKPAEGLRDILGPRQASDGGLGERPPEAARELRDPPAKAPQARPARPDRAP